MTATPYSIEMIDKWGNNAAQAISVCGGDYPVSVPTIENGIAFDSITNAEVSSLFGLNNKMMMFSDPMAPFGPSMYFAFPGNGNYIIDINAVLTYRTPGRNPSFSITLQISRDYRNSWGKTKSMRQKALLMTTLLICTGKVYRSKDNCRNRRLSAGIYEG